MYVLSSYTCLSHQSLSRLAVAIATYKIQVFATDSQFIPTIATVVSKPLPINPDIYITQSERIIYYATTLLVVGDLCNPNCGIVTPLSALGHFGATYKNNF